MATAFNLPAPKWPLANAMVVVVFVVALVIIKPWETAGDPELGQPLYETHCLSCHGKTGAGDGPLATDLPEAPPNIAQKVKGLFEFDALLISNVIMPGKPDAGMPAFEGVISEQEAQDILAYVRTLK